MTVLHAPPKSDPTATALGLVAVPRDVHPYWLDLLQRCGVRAEAGLAGCRAPVAFVPPDTAVAPDEIEVLRQRGVGLVGGARLASDLGLARVEQRTLKGLAGEGPLFAGCAHIALPCRVAAVQGTLLHFERNAPVVALPLPSADAALCARPALRDFAPAGPPVAEIVAGVDHGGLRRLVHNALQLACHSLALPSVHLGTAPVGHLGVFAVRIDADDFDAAATRAVLDGLARGGFDATWFIDVERHERKGGEAMVRAIQAAGHEVQSHFYHHYTYRSAARNQRNLRRSLRVLSAWGVDARAAAAPFGGFHGGVAYALAVEETCWSSEFSAAYDDHPGRFTGALQVPVHPVCPILLLGAGHDAQGVVEYYSERLRRGLASGETNVFYGHPIRDLEAVPGLFPALRAVLDAHEKVTGMRVWQPTLGELAAFHDSRRAQAFTCELAAGELRGHCTGAAPLVVTGPERSLCVSGRFAVAAPALRGANPDPLCRPWTPRSDRGLRRRARAIRFRRWLREIRKR